MLHCHGLDFLRQTLKPDTAMTFPERSTKGTLLCASIVPRSPVRSHRSGVSARAVSSSMFQ
ncbi:hypothetical protein D9M72_415450 [compost metagenome]